MIHVRIGAAVTAPVVFLMFVLAGCAGRSTDAQLPRAAERTSSDSIGFLLVGDTGYVPDDPAKSGLSNVATAMYEHCQHASCEFALMAGDNIYPDGAAGDPGDAALFRTRFTEPFDRFAQLGEDFRIYVALGNHDWRTSRAGALAQVAFHERNPPFYMHGLYYSVRPRKLEQRVEIFVIDTEMLLAPFTLPDMDPAADGSMVASGKTYPGGSANALPVTAAEHAQLEWLENALSRSTAKWKLVLGHHPLWQSRPDEKHMQSSTLRQLLLPLLCRYADAYFAGHQHTLEVSTDSCAGSTADSETLPLPNIVSGAGAKVRNVNTPYLTWQQRAWPQFRSLWASGEQWGFTHLSVDGDFMDLRMLIVGRDGATEEAFRTRFPNR